MTSLLAKSWPIAALLASVAVLIGSTTVVHNPLYRPNYTHYLTTVIVGLYIWAYFERRNLRKHLWLVIAGIWLDTGLTVWHEVGLRAISFALGVTSKPFEGNYYLLQLHIWAASALLVSYVLVWLSGRSLAPPGWLWLPPLPEGLWLTGFLRRKHTWLGYGTLVLALLSWLSAPYFVGDLLLTSR
jgi:hypothetical protein